MDHELLLRARLRAEGFSDKEVRRRLRAGNLRRIRRGAYLAGPPPDDAAYRHLLLVRPAVAQLGADPVLSHASAAVMHGLATWDIPLDRAHADRSGGRRGTSVHVHTAALDPDGRVKYGAQLRPGQDPGNVVFEEKRREDALRDGDLGVVRWIWRELDDFAPVATRLRRRFR